MNGENGKCILLKRPHDQLKEGGENKDKAQRASTISVTQGMNDFLRAVVKYALY